LKENRVSLRKWQNQKDYRIRGVIFFEFCGEGLFPESDIQIAEWVLGGEGIKILERKKSGLIKFKFAEDKIQIMSDISQVKNSFDDLQDRQIFLAKLRNSICNLMEKLGSDSRLKLRVLNLAFDALKNIRSEYLKKEHIDTLEFVIGMLDKDLDDVEINNLQEILIKSGLNPTPQLEGIAELY